MPKIITTTLIALLLLSLGTNAWLWSKNSTSEADVLAFRGKLVDQEARYDELKKERDEAFSYLSQQILESPSSLPLSDIINPFGNSSQLARDAQRKANLAEVRTALELYFDDNVEYPTTESYQALEATLSPTYIRELPQDPTEGQSFEYSGSGVEFELTAHLEEDEEEYKVYSAN